MDLALITSTARRVSQTHVVGKSVDGAPLKRCEGRGENQGFTARIFLEQKKLRIEL